MVKFNEQDIKRGCKVCDCGRKHILESGADYPEDQWILCEDCKCYVVDEELGGDAA